MSEVIKVVKSGQSVSTTDPRMILFSSEYPMFKYHQVSTGSISIPVSSLGSSSSITHGLGYIPAFIAYYKRSDQSQYYIIPSYPNSSEQAPFGVNAYADTNQVTVEVNLSSPYGLEEHGWGLIQPQLTNSVTALAGNIGGDIYGCSCLFGRDDGGIQLTKGQSFSSAVLNWTRCFSGTSSDTKLITYGIDEDDVSGLSSDLSEPRTSTSRTQNVAYSSGFFNFGIDVTNELNSIINRSGWSVGNKVGFLTLDNGSPSNTYIAYVTNNFNLVLDIYTATSLTVDFKVIVFKDKIA